MTSRAWKLDGGFGPSHLSLVERALPEPGPGQVRVRIRALSLNYRDLMIVRGEYDPRMPLPRVPLSDAAGEIDAIGSAVRRFQPGDRVCPVFAPGWVAGDPPADATSFALGHRVDGVASDHVIVSEGDLVRIPAHLDFLKAATLPCAAVTAWHALSGDRPVRPGETVLVQGSGGVSLFALQLARLAGAQVIATSSDPSKLDRLQALGAAHTLNYRENPQWGKAVRALTGGRGVDRVIEVGGASTLAESLVAVRPSGQIAVIGVLAGRAAPIDVTSILMRNVRLQGIFVGSRAHFEALNQAVETSGLQPVVDRVFDFEALPDALDHLASGRHFGKVALRIGPS